MLTTVAFVAVAVAVAVAVKDQVNDNAHVNAHVKAPRAAPLPVSHAEEVGGEFSKRMEMRRFRFTFWKKHSTKQRSLYTCLSYERCLPMRQARGGMLATHPRASIAAMRASESYPLSATTFALCMRLSSSGACVMSCAWPSVREIRTAFPRASTTT